MTIKGIDISHHQGNVDLNKAKKSGVSFVYIKATEGSTYIDPMFEANTKKAKDAGLPIGFYHFANPSNSPLADADNFIANITKFDYDLVPVLDLEVNKGKSGQQLYNWAKSFIDRVESKTGHQVMIYTGLAFVERYIDLKDLNNRPLWIAAYRSISKPPKVSGWDWTMWQYSETENVDGVGSCDCNIIDDLSKIMIAKKIEYKENNELPLKLGDKGDKVKQLQVRLKITADGLFGYGTRESVMDWQRLHDKYGNVVNPGKGLRVTGVVDEETWNALFPKDSELPLSVGSRGKLVEQLQKRLQIKVDGIFGELTKTAVMNWQQVHDKTGKVVPAGKGLKVDGVVGEETWNALFPKDEPQPNPSNIVVEVPIILTVLADTPIYAKADWNTKAGQAHKGDTFEVTHRYKVGNGYMYQLKSGQYITADPSFVDVH